MNSKKIISCLLMSLIFVSFASAITGTIGNARMILRLEQGEEIERYILVRNVNNISVNIELFASGDLEDKINIKDESFVLESGEEKKAYFTIKPTEIGTTESRVHVRFEPVEGKDGVGLVSTIIVITSENKEYNENSKGLFITNLFSRGETDNKEKFSFFKDNKGNLRFNFLIILFLLSFVLLLVLLLILAKTKPKKEVHKK